MLKVLVPLALVLVSAAPSVAVRDGGLDAVVAAPGSHRVLFENERVRMLRVAVAPGQTEPVHTHRWPSVMYFEQPQPITYLSYRLVAGKPVQTEAIDVPQMPRSLTEAAGPEGLHAVRNRGTRPFLAVRTEFKDGSVVP